MADWLTADWDNLTSIAERVNHLRQTIPPQTRIVAVTKTVSVERMREAYAAGIRDFGENRIQEAIAKQEALSDLRDVTWHFIGHLQSNKAKQALAHFQWLHSVDSLALAQRLDRLAADLSAPPQVCLQVKLRDDPSKFGWIPEELLSSLAELQACKALSIRGLMTILPANLSPDDRLKAFQDTQKLAQQIDRHPSTPLPTSELSMGMSEDFPLAVRAGATMIRPGRVLFGARSAA
jgi:PLP dependent protein